MIWNWCVLLLVAASAASCCGKKKTGGYLRTDKGLILSQKGKTRAALKIENGNPYLEFYDKDGKTSRLSLFLSEDGRSVLQFMDSKGRNRASLAVGKAGKSVLVFSDTKGPRLAMGFKPSAGWAGLQLWDRQGKERVTLDSESNGASLKLHGTGKYALLSLISLYKHDKAVILMFDKKGRIVFAAPRKKR